MRRLETTEIDLDRPSCVPLLADMLPVDRLVEWLYHCDLQRIRQLLKRPERSAPLRQVQDPRA